MKRKEGMEKEEQKKQQREKAQEKRKKTNIFIFFSYVSKMKEKQLIFSFL